MHLRRDHAIKALTLDLDDTLWPVRPAIERAEREVHAWLDQNAPATARRFDIHALRGMREAVAVENPHWGHDFTRMRLASIARALTLAGDDAALAAPAFEVFLAARNRVELFADTRPALARLSRQWPIVALTNGNADLHSIGLADHFTATLSAREFGVGKPDSRIFHEACRQLGAKPREVLHVGDDWTLDVLGAHAAGLRSAWICRAHDVIEPDGPVRADCVARDLGELAAWLER
jgi:putative hydrolase of the HAD superfamily